jgi:hypothetical protein
VATPGEWGRSGPAGGDPTSTPPPPQTGEQRVRAPQNVTVTVLGGGSFKVTWNDIRYRFADGELRETLLDHWRVIYASTEVAGSPTGGEQWADRVANIGLGIYETHASGQGALISYTHTDTSLGDGWVVVVGISVTGLIGHPSQPAYVRLESATTALADDVTDVDLAVERRTVNGYQVLRLYPEYTSPSDMDQFWGVQLYVNGFHEVDLEEIASPHKFPTDTGGEPIPPDSWKFDIPAGDFPGSSLGLGTATFTNGSKNVVWASGDTFSAGMATRPIYIKEFSTVDGLWTTNTVDVFTDATHIVLLNNFTGVTGVYSWDVQQILIVYFVSLNRRGGRTATPTSAPNRTV